jgi:hypothetical protein
MGKNIRLLTACACNRFTFVVEFEGVERRVDEFKCPCCGLRYHFSCLFDGNEIAFLPCGHAFSRDGVQGGGRDAGEHSG